MRTVVLCTHDLAEAEQLCDRVVVLQHGRVVADGAPTRLAARFGTGGIQIEVASDDVATARRHLMAAASGEIDVDGLGRLRGSGVPRDAIPRLVRELAGSKVAVYEIRRLDPTLEDVYLRLHSQQNDESPAKGRRELAWDRRSRRA